MIFRMIFHASIMLGLGLVLLDTRINTGARVAAGVISIVPYAIYIFSYIENLGKPVKTKEQIECSHDFTSSGDGYDKIVKTHCIKCGHIGDVKKID